jgi:hypothetical protein
VDKASEAVVVVVAVELDVTEEDKDVVNVVKVGVGVADSALAGQQSATSLYKGHIHIIWTYHLRVICTANSIRFRRHTANCLRNM